MPNCFPKCLCTEDSGRLSSLSVRKRHACFTNYRESFHPTKERASLFSITAANKQSPKQWPRQMEHSISKAPYRLQNSGGGWARTIRCLWGMATSTLEKVQRLLSSCWIHSVVLPYCCHRKRKKTWTCSQQPNSKLKQRSPSPLGNSSSGFAFYVFQL